MSYCRFQNTSKDLRDCLQAMREENMKLDSQCEDSEEEGLSRDEYTAMKYLFELCQEILEEKELLEGEGRL